MRAIENFLKTIVRNLFPQFIKNIIHKYEGYYFAWRNGNPSRSLKVIGITGTDGKTTTSNLLYEILKVANKKVGLITTISAKIGKEEYQTGFHVTSPHPRDLQKFLKKMVDAGMEYVVLETTSHALDQYRVVGIDCIAAIYTNITHEHLDYHGTYEEYLATKARLIDQVEKDGFVVINRDDISYKHLSSILKATSHKVFKYGFSKKADIYGKDISRDRRINHFKVLAKNGNGFDIRLKMIGGYNAYNALAATTAALELGVKPKVIVKALESIQSLEGRWEEIIVKPFKVVVDFAHTPNALQNVLKVAREQVDENHNVIVVFGSAGERDQEKRPKMGAAAGKYADKIILTAEDPRTEDVNQINRDIESGIKKYRRKPNRDYFSIIDRREAIAKALMLARPGDIVLITGKGHEKSMNLDGVEEVDWSDVKVTRELLGLKQKK